MSSSVLQAVINTTTNSGKAILLSIWVLCF
ncbi:MAG: hypothetical protein ACI9YE_001950 [Psychroserpens sp.]|jgi:hypothetical protein